MVQRLPVEGDRRALLIRLTPTGRKAFAEMADAHERWIIEALSGLNQREVQSLHTLLGKVKQRINSQESTNA